MIETSSVCKLRVSSVLGSIYNYVSRAENLNVQLANVWSTFIDFPFCISKSFELGHKNKNSKFKESAITFIPSVQWMCERYELPQNLSAQNVAHSWANRKNLVPAAHLFLISGRTTPWNARGSIACTLHLHSDQVFNYRSRVQLACAFIRRRSSLQKEYNDFIWWLMITGLFSECGPVNNCADMLVVAGAMIGAWHGLWLGRKAARGCNPTLMPARMFINTTIDERWHHNCL